MDYAGKWSYDVRCHTCITLRARVAELEAQLATARAEERERIDGILDFRKQTAEVRHLRDLITPTPTPTPEANRE